MPTFRQWLYILLIPLVVASVLAGLLVYSLVSEAERDPVVRSRVGSIRGLRADDGDYDMYLGVPYARVDKKNVFGPSVAYGKFKKAYRANDDSIICPQYEEFNKTITGSLDCLRLNIYVPHASSITTCFPVLVFIHGGDYKSGFGGRQRYGPKYLMKQNIIMVTVNYRIGPYGFLCTQVSGNQGLKDQLIALQWIQDNIEYFGGCPDQVTLAGVGSGGENVNIHLLYGKKLFQKVIIDSGIYLDQLDDEDGVDSVPIELAGNLGFTTDSEIEALNFLNAKNPKSVIASSMRLHLQYGPCIENNITGIEAFITEQTLNSTAEGLRTIPVLVSQSNKELLRVFGRRNLDDSEAYSIFRDDIAEHFKLRDEKLRNAEKKVRQFYIGKENIGEAVKSKIIDFKSDLYQNVPTRRMIDTYIKKGLEKLYYGVFSYSGGRNFVKKVYNITADGTAKEDVLGYLFDMPYLSKSVAEDDELVIDRITALWANFVKYGDPTPTTSELLPVRWLPVNRSKLNYMEISSELTPRVTPFYNRTVFWELFFREHGQKEIQTKLIEPWIS